MCCLLLGACDPQKQPAEKAYAQVETSVGPVREMLEKYAPEDYEKLNQMLEMKDKVMAQLVTASSVAGQKKISVTQSLSAEWKSLAASMPGMIDQVSGRVNSLLSATKLPAGVTHDTVVRSQAIVAQLSGQWNGALSSAQRNALDDAVKQAREVKKRCIDVASALNLKLTEG